MWSYISQFTSQGLTFIISIILARLLTPEIFGIMGMALIVVEIGNTIKGIGLGSSIIQNKNLDQKAYSTFFYFQLLTGLFLSVLVFFIAPLFAKFFNEDKLTEIIQAIAILFLLHSVVGVPSSLINKELQYKKLVMVNMVSLVVGGVTGIWMAIIGYGIWSLVVYHIIKIFLDGVMLIIVTRWVPVFHFKWYDIRQVLPYSSGIYGTTLVTAILSQMNRILLAKFMPTAQLGLYNKALGIRRLPEQLYYNGINKLSFPLFSKHQHNNKQIGSYINRIQQLLAFAFAPTMVFIFVLAEPIIVVLLGEKWIDSTVFLRFLALAGILGKLSDVNQSILKAKGHTKFLFRFNLIEGIISTIMMFLIIKYYGLIPFLSFLVIRSTIRAAIRFYLGEKFIDLSVYRQLKNIFPFILNALISGVIIYIAILYLDMHSSFLNLAMGLLIGTMCYLLLCIIQKLDLIRYLQYNIRLLFLDKGNKI